LTSRKPLKKKAGSGSVNQWCGSGSQPKPHESGTMKKKREHKERKKREIDRWWRDGLTSSCPLLNFSTSLQFACVMCQSKGSTGERQKKEREKRELEGGMRDRRTNLLLTIAEL
jgi:hypothetical protein